MSYSELQMETNFYSAGCALIKNRPSWSASEASQGLTMQRRRKQEVDVHTLRGGGGAGLEL